MAGFPTPSGFISTAMFSITLMTSGTLTSSNYDNFPGTEAVLYSRAPTLRDSRSRSDFADLLHKFMAEASSPPPCSVELASLPMPEVIPPEAREGTAWLAQLNGGPRERRAIRDRVEKKDALL